MSMRIEIEKNKAIMMMAEAFWEDSYCVKEIVLKFVDGDQIIYNPLTKVGILENKEETANG